MAIGRWLGIPAYSGLAGIRMIESAKKVMAKARRDDTKELKKDDKAKERVKALLRGKSGKYTLKFSNTEFTRVTRAMMVSVRDEFKGSVIRRTIESCDFEGNSISDLPPRHETMVILRQSPEEEEEFLKYTDNMALNANEERAGRVLGSKMSEVSTHFGCVVMVPVCAPPGHSAHRT